MSNTGQPNFSGAKAFQSGGSSSSIGRIPSIGFLTFGVGSMGVAVMTALTPPSAALFGQAAQIMDKVGLDKGPLLMFGALSTAMGFALSRLERASSSGEAAADAVAVAQSNASGIELQGELLAAVQGELGAIRGELTAARHEAAEEKEKAASGNGEANDPLFRLAASLDQLGAQIDKRIDKARREMVDAITGVASSGEVSAQQREDSFKACATDIDSVRLDIADLRAQLTRVAGEVTNTKGLVEGLDAGLVAAPDTAHGVPIVTQDVAAPLGDGHDETPAPLPQTPIAAATPATPPAATCEVSAEVASPTAALPKELTEEPHAAPLVQYPAAGPEATAEATGEPHYEGYHHSENTPAQAAPPAAGPVPQAVDMQNLGFPEPPPPMPKPSEGLRLIDDMDDDTARQHDATPPLFPDV